MRMKKILFSLMIMVLSTLKAQDHIESQLIHYHISYNNLFDRGKDFKQYDAVLLMQGDRSLFTMKLLGKIEDSYQSNYIDESPDSIFTVFKDFESNSLLFEFYHFQQGNVKYSDTLHPMEWKLEGEEKTVGGIPCKKAKVRFKGRDYVAWYAPSIPISNGPWKLGGLPGLILEAYDEKNDWHAVYSNMKNTGFIDFSGYEKIVQKGAAGFPDFIKDLKNVLKRMNASISNKESEDCLTCASRSTITLYVWEKID